MNHTKCAACRQLLCGVKCPQYWTRCQACDRGMMTDDAVTIQEYSAADFCIQCAHNISYMAGDLNAGMVEVIIMYSQAIRPFREHLGRTEVINIENTRACAVCRHRISPKETCCSTCKYSYYLRTMGGAMPKTHADAIWQYMV